MSAWVYRQPETEFLSCSGLLINLGQNPVSSCSILKPNLETYFLTKKEFTVFLLQEGTLETLGNSV